MENAFISLTSVLTGVYDLVAVGLSILLIVAQWMLMEKAGEPGWASLIPFYREYCLYKIANKLKLFWWWLGTSIVTVVAYIVCFIQFLIIIAKSVTTLGSAGLVARSSQANITLLISCIIIAIVGIIATFVFNVLLCTGISTAFGQGTGFAVGLIFLPFIFYCIIAFSSNIQYVGSQQDYPDYNPDDFNPNM